MNKLPSGEALVVARKVARTQEPFTSGGITLTLEYKPFRLEAVHTAYPHVATVLTAEAKDILPNRSIEKLALLLKQYKAGTIGNATDNNAMFSNLINHGARLWQEHADNVPLYELRSLVRSIYIERDYTELEKVVINHSDYCVDYASMDIATCTFWLRWAWEHWGKK
jgi:hypothetical protein